jgi:2',3'-cyclic-nucleotide 2'-phosphodiesterase (5'-nucleotidase family)
MQRLTRLVGFALFSIGVGTFTLAVDRDSREVTFFFTGFVRGSFGPCGCSAGPTGGVSRRAGYAQTYEKEHGDFVLHVDAGNYLQPPGPRAAEINELMIESLEELPIRVLNLATDDLFWWKNLSENRPAGTEVISTNLMPERPHLPSPKKYAVVTIPAEKMSLKKDLQIGFLGLSDPARVKPNSGFRGIDPLQAVASVKEKVLEEADFLIVLADIRRRSREIREESVIRQLAESHPEISVVILTEKRFRLFDPVQINSTLVLSSVERGRYLGRLTMSLDESGTVEGTDSDWIELKEGVPEVPDLRAKGEWINSLLP